MALRCSMWPDWRASFHSTRPGSAALRGGGNPGGYPRPGSAAGLVPARTSRYQVGVGRGSDRQRHSRQESPPGRNIRTHVTCFELLRSSGERLLCSPESNPELYRATIGGLGLTGLILWAEVRLEPVPGAAIAMERIRFPRLQGFFELSTTTMIMSTPWPGSIASRGGAARGAASSCGATMPRGRATRHRPAGA